MQTPEDLIGSLEQAKADVRKMAWALCLHLSHDMHGGAPVVERQAAEINGRISDAIDRIKTDAAERA